MQIKYSKVENNPGRWDIVVPPKETLASPRRIIIRDDDVCKEVSSSNCDGWTFFFHNKDAVPKPTYSKVEEYRPLLLQNNGG
jgi:hypothetical protein